MKDFNAENSFEKAQARKVGSRKGEEVLGVW